MTPLPDYTPQPAPGDPMTHPDDHAMIHPDSWEAAKQQAKLDRLRGPLSERPATLRDWLMLGFWVLFNIGAAALFVALMAGCEQGPPGDIPAGAFWGSQHFPIIVDIDESMTQCKRDAVDEQLAAWDEEIAALGEPTRLFVWREVPADHLSVISIPNVGHVGVTEGPLTFTPVSSTVGLAELFMIPISKRIVSAIVTLDDRKCNASTEAAVKHEFGHVLGLQHAPGRKCLMYPSVPSFGIGELHEDELTYVLDQVKGLASLDAPSELGEDDDLESDLMTVQAR